MKYFPVKNLKRADYNPRIMSESEMDALMLSISTHGFVEPLIVNTNPNRYGFIVGGHQRLTAIELLLAKGVIINGLKKSEKEEFGIEVPVFEVDLGLEAEKQLNIGLNKIHGKFDENKLYDLIISMKDSFTLPSTGFSTDEISNILNHSDKSQHSSSEDSDHVECSRCRDLKLQLQGHSKKSGHVIILEKNEKPTNN